MSSGKFNIDNCNYLFLDRDGVINVERPGDYVKKISEFIFEEGALDAISVLSKRYDKIFIITNQRGVGRGIMSSHDLAEVHNFMLSEIRKAGGAITNIYVCVDTVSTSINRKPNIGMAFQVVEQYPEIDFNKSIFVGNSKSDIEFGNKLGMFTVLVSDKYPQDDKIYSLADANYKNLYKFAQAIEYNDEIQRI